MNAATKQVSEVETKQNTPEAVQTWKCGLDTHLASWRNSGTMTV